MFEKSTHDCVCRHIDREDFFIQMLLALRIVRHRDRFLATGKNFYDAFEAVVNRVREQGIFTVDSIEWANRDPIYGVFPWADDLIMFGMFSCVLNVAAPGHSVALFRLTRPQAQKQLDEIDGGENFLELAELFNEHLGDDEVDLPIDLTHRGSIERAVAGALMCAINDHGTINEDNMPNVVRQVVGAIKNYNRNLDKGQ